MFFLCLFSWLKSNSKVCTWKWMVRIRSDFLLGQFWPIFGGEVFAVSFRERIGSEWPEHPLATAEVGLVLCALIWPLDYQGRCRGFLFVSKRCHPKIPKSLQWNFVERFDSRKGKTYPKVWKKTAWKSCGLRKSCGSWWGLFECWNTTLTTWSPSWWYCYWTLKSASASAKHGIYIDGPGISFLRSERLALYDMCHNGEKFHSSVFFTLQIMWARPFNRKWSKFFCC